MSKSDDVFTQQRQALIIAAAKRCFSRSGFHGASMSEISQESGLGAGQIYRYFISKEIIVAESIKSIAQHWRLFLLNKLPLQTSTADIIDIHSSFWQNWTLEDRRLLLETYSEASRNEAVRTVLKQEEEQLIADLETAFAQKMPHSTKPQRRNRIQFLLLLVDGVTCRVFTDNALNRAEMERVNDIFSTHIFK